MTIPAAIDEINPILKALEQRLNESEANQQVTFNAATIGAADIVQMLGYIMGAANPALTVSGAQITTSTDNITVVGQAVLPGNVQVTNVNAVFEAPDNQLTLKLDLTLGSWTFARSFPELAESFFDNLTLAAPHFVLASRDYTYTSADGSLQVPIHSGLNFFAQLTVAGVLQPAQSVLANIPNLVTLFGVIEMHGDQRDFRLATTMLTTAFTLNFTGITLPLTDISLVLESLASSDGSSRDSRAAIEATTNLNIKKRIDIQLPLELSGWGVGLVPGAQNSLTMTDLLDLVGARQASTVALPGELMATLNTPSLSQFSINFSPTADSPTLIDFAVSADAAWDIIPGRLALSAITVAVNIAYYPATANFAGQTLVSGLLSGTLSIGSVAIPVALAIPGSSDIDWVLQVTSSTITLPTIAELAQIIGDTNVEGPSFPVEIGHLQGLSISDLEIKFNPFSLSLSSVHFMVEYDLDWNVLPGISFTAITLNFQIDDPLNSSNSRKIWWAIVGSSSIAGADLTVCVTSPNASNSDWRLLLVSTEGAYLPNLSTMLSFVGGGQAPALVPQGLSNIGLFALRRFEISINSSRRAIDHVSLAMGTPIPWEVVENILSIENLDIELEIIPGASASLAGLISGTVSIGGVDFLLTAQKADATANWVLSGEIRPGKAIALTNLIADLLPEGITLPPEIPESLLISDISLSITPATGELTLHGSAMAQWELFGISGLLVSLAFDLQRGAATTAGVQARTNPLTCSLTLEAHGTYTIVDGITFTGVALAFKLDQQNRAWMLAGTVDASIFDTACTFTASLTESATLRTIEFSYKATAPITFLDLADVGSLSGQALQVLISKKLQEGTDAGGNGLNLGSGGYNWEVIAAGGLTLAGLPARLDGKLALYKQDSSIGLAFQPTVAQVDLPMPEPIPAVAIHLSLVSLAIVSTTDSQGKRLWVFDTTVSIWLSGLPTHIQAIVPSETTKVTAHFKADNQEVTLGVDQLIPAQDFKLPTTKVAGRDLGLGTAMVEATNLQLRLGHGIALAASFGIGLPQGLNTIFGVKDDGSPAVELFNTYQPGKSDTITKFQLALDSSAGLQVQVTTSPIKKISIVTEGQDRWCYADMGSFGAVKFLVPVFSFSEGSFSGRGSFTQTRELMLPLTPLKWLLAACGLSVVANKLPAGLPLRELKIYDTATNHFNSAALIQMLVDAGIPLSDDIKNALQSIEGQLDKLPDRFKSYLDIVIPKSFSFEITLSTDGRFQGSVTVDKSTPIKVLYPVLGSLGPQLNGIEFYGFTVGELLNGSLLLLNIDGIIDQFDLVTLISALALPLDKLPILPRTQDLSATTILRNLFMLIIYEAIIPIPVPLFFDQLGLDYMGLPGLGIHTHWSFPKPHLSMGDVSTLFSNFERFFTDHNYLLDTGKPPQNLDLVLTIGPNYIQLPQYLGSATLGSKTDTTVISAYENLAHLLNALKRLSLNELIQVIPPDKRAGKEQITFACMTLEADWLITTLQEFRAGSYTQLGISATDVDSVARVLPPSPRQDGQGVAFFFKGLWTPVEGAKLDACISLLGTESGFSTGMRIAGTITSLLEIELTGSVVINSASADPFDLSGASHLRIFNDTVFNGSLRLADKNFAIDGDLDLFPQTMALRITGHITGHLSNTELLIAGSATATFGNGFTLAGGAVKITSAGITLTGIWLNQTVTFSAQKAGGTLQLQATLSRIEIGEAFKVTNATGNTGPLAQLGVSTANPRLFLSGSIYLLGIQATTTVNFTASGFTILVEGKVFSLYQATVQATGTDLLNGSTFTVAATLKDDGLFNSLASACGSALKEGSDEASRKLSDAQAGVETARAQVNSLNGQIAVRTQQLQQQMADALGKLRSAQDGVAAAQKQVNDITSQLTIARQNAQSRLNIANSQLSIYQTQVSSAQSSVDSLQSRIDYLQQDIKQRFPLDPKVAEDGAELAGLYPALTTAKGVLSAANKTLETVQRGLNLTPVEADPTVVVLEAQQRAYISGLQIAQGTLAAAQATVQSIPAIDLDPQIIALRASLAIAQAGLDGANLSLNSAQKTSDAYGQVGTYIAQNGLSGLVSIKGARFNGVLNAVKDATVTLSVDVQFAGRAQVQTYTIISDLHNLLGGASALANELVTT